MAEAINRGRELDGHERDFLPVEETKLRFVVANARFVLEVGEDLLDDILTGDGW